MYAVTNKPGQKEMSSISACICDACSRWERLITIGRFETCSHVREDSLRSSFEKEVHIWDIWQRIGLTSKENSVYKSWLLLFLSDFPNFMGYWCKSFFTTNVWWHQWLGVSCSRGGPFLALCGFITTESSGSWTDCISSTRVVCRNVNSWKLLKLK